MSHVALAPLAPFAFAFALATVLLAASHAHGHTTTTTTTAVTDTDTLHWIHGVDISAAISESTGHVVHLNASSGWQRDVVGRSWVTDAPGGVMEHGATTVTPTKAGGGVVVTRTMLHVQGFGTAALQNFTATITDVFLPHSDPSVGGLTWETRVTTPSVQPWRAVVATELTVAPKPKSQASAMAYWLPHNGRSMAEDVLQLRNASDTRPGFVAELGMGYIWAWWHTLKGPTTSMPYPLFLWAGSTAGADAGGGLIVAPRLNDTTLGAMATLNSTALRYSRVYNKQQAGRTTSFTTHLGSLNPPASAAVDARLPVHVRSDDAWRDALRFAMAVSPTYFNSVTPVVEPKTGQPTTLATCGMGVYTCAPASSINISTTVELAGASVLWDASFWWPYIGLGLPPVPDAETEWASNLGGSEQANCSSNTTKGGFVHGQQVSATNIKTHLREMVENGISVPLSYFNLFEFGQNVQWPLPAAVPGCSSNASCWSNSSVMLASELADAILFTSAADKKPSYTWQGAVVLDPGVASFKRFLTEQAQRHTTLLGGDFHGVAIDRTDHTTSFSHTRDDGLSWCGAPCASMLPAWIDASAAVSAAVHYQAAPGSPGSPPTSAPVVLVNYAGSTRMELLEHADGIFSEEGDAILNSIGLSAIAMPAIGWTYPSTGNKTINDAYLQRHLRMGVQPTAPVYGADHSLDDADKDIDLLYRDYGTLFRAIRATRWGTDRSHVISIDPPPASGGPLHNVFASLDPRSSVSPWTVVLALADPAIDSVRITLKLPFGNRPAGCEVQLPGLANDGTARTPEKVVVVSQRRVGRDLLIQLTARLHRGCAVLQCTLT